jgi:hypothetical protein
MAGMSTHLRSGRVGPGRVVALVTLASTLAFAGCVGDDDDTPGSGGTAGQGGQAGKAGAGQAGTVAGRAGEAGALVGGEGGEAGGPSTGGAGGVGGGSGGSGGKGGSAGDGATAGVSGQSMTGGGPNAGGASGSSAGGEAGAASGEGGGQQGGDGGVGGSVGGTAGAGGTAGVGTGGTAGTGGGGSNPCGGPSACTCLKVAPDGDDTAAASSNGATPFESIHAALDFAQANPGAPRDVCVASGSTCGASATFDFDGNLELRDGIGVYGKYESTSFTRCDGSITTLFGNDSSSRIRAFQLINGPTRLDGFTVGVPIDVDRSNGVTLADLVATTVTFDRALSSSIEGSTIVASGVTALSVTRSDVDVTDNFVESDVPVDAVVYVQSNTEGRIVGNDFSSTAGAWALIVERRVAELSGNTIRSTGSGLWLDGTGIDAVGNDISGTLALQINGSSRVSGNTITAGRGRDVLAVYGDSFTLENNDIRSASADPLGDSRGVLCTGGCTLLGNRVDISGGNQHAIVFEDEGCVADGNRVYTTQLSSADSAFRGFAGTVRNNVLYGVVRLFGPVTVQHNTVQGQLWFHGTDAVVEGNIVRSLGTPLVKSSDLIGVSVPWGRLTRNDLLPGSSGRFFQTVNSFGQTVDITSVNDLNLVTDPLRTTVTNGNFSADPLYSTFPHLSPGSPCIDAGDASAPGDVDFDGEPRSGAKDVGADEFSVVLPCGGATCSAPGGLYCLDVGRASQCVCATGYTNPPGEPLECEVDECATDNGGCDDLTFCTNTFPGRTCTACPAGYSGTGATGCDDIDECQTGNGGCDVLRTCRNIPGGRSCEPCPSGYYTVGETACADQNECMLFPNGNCDELTTCTNVPGGRTCSACPTGYLGTGETGCYLDECAVGNGGCDPLVTCANTSGGPSCGACPTGYLGTGASGCYADVCATGNGGCDDLTTCTSTPGGADCGDCPPGYVGTGETGCEEDDTAFVQVSAGTSHSCGIRESGALECWGHESFFYSTRPLGQVFRAVSAGAEHTIAIRDDGTLVFWGNDQGGLGSVPSGTFDSVVAGYAHDCAMRTDGTLACWGWNGSGQTNPPSGVVAAYDVGTTNTCVLHVNGTIQCVGSNDNGESVPPGGTFQALTVHGIFGCGLRGDGSVECWGYTDLAGWQPTHPGPFEEIQGTGNGFTVCGRQPDDTLLCYGNSTGGLASPPLGAVASYSMGVFHGCAVMEDDSVACWGANDDGQSSPP